jgi:hypothetical protein
MRAVEARIRAANAPEFLYEMVAVDIREREAVAVHSRPDFKSELHAGPSAFPHAADFVTALQQIGYSTEYARARRQAETRRLLGIRLETLVSWSTARPRRIRAPRDGDAVGARRYRVGVRVFANAAMNRTPSSRSGMAGEASVAEMRPWP